MQIFLSFSADRSNADRVVPTIAVFSITGGESGDAGCQDIAFAGGPAQVERLGAVRLEVFGRGAENARARLERALEGSGVALRLRGILPAGITRTLAGSGVLLFVRGLAASRRGTFVSGIACGLPIIGYGEAGVDPAIDAAGVQLVPWHDIERLAETLTHVLADSGLRLELHKRSVIARNGILLLGQDCRPLH